MTNLLTDKFLLEPPKTIDVLKLKSQLFLRYSETVLTSKIVVGLSNSKDHRVNDFLVSCDPVPVAMLPRPLRDATNVSPTVEVKRTLNRHLHEVGELVAGVECGQVHAVCFAEAPRIHPTSLELH